MLSIPFSGSKRYSYKPVRQIVLEGGYKYSFEPFGGSCVLSVNLRDEYIVKQAVVNDYDHFFDHYEEYLDLKDLVVRKCLEAGLRPTKRGKSTGCYYVNLDGSKEYGAPFTLNKHDRKILQRIIKENVDPFYWHYFTSGGNFMHSAVGSHTEVGLSDFCCFASYLPTDRQRMYLRALNNCIVENLDYMDFINKYENKLSEDSIFIIDPPYTGTYQGQYKEAFSEEDTIELIERVKRLNVDFIFFNHDKELVEKWLEGLNYSIQITGSAQVSANHKRRDVMAYVKR